MNKKTIEGTSTIVHNHLSCVNNTLENLEDKMYVKKTILQEINNAKSKLNEMIKNNHESLLNQNIIELGLYIDELVINYKE